MAADDERVARRAERDLKYLRATEKARAEHDAHLAEIDGWLASLDALIQKEEA